MSIQFSSSEGLFIIGTVTFLLAYFMFKPKAKLSPSQLKLKNKSKDWFKKSNSLPPSENYDPGQLNLVFEHQGKTWDAYEVLGLPAGCDLNMARQAYKKSPKSELARRAIVLIEQHLS